MTFTTAICLEDIGANILENPITIYCDKDFYITPITTTTLSQVTSPNCPLILNNIPIGATKIKLVSENNLCTFIDIQEPPFFQAVFDTTKNGQTSTNQLKLPFISAGTYDVYIDWGDGGPWNNVKTWNDPSLTHTYSSAGVYNVKIYAFPGFFKGFNYYNSTGNNTILGDRLKILEVLRWGPINLGNNGSYFSGCTNLNLANVTDVLNLDGTTNFKSMFHSCTNLTCINRVNEWDTSNVTSMEDTFNGATNYNCDLSGWTTSKVNNMQGMFQLASKFNKNIGNWITSACTNMAGMFDSAVSFDNFGSDTINNWDTSNVKAMGYMFSNAWKFNRNVGNWNTSKVTGMGYMFHKALVFDNNGSNSINNWVTSAVTQMGHMFAFAAKFNRTIGSWDVRKVTSSGPNSLGFTAIFKGASLFNQNIGAWDMRNAKDCDEMFNSATAFNNGGSADINNWVTSAITNMKLMFISTVNFDQPLNLWDTRNVQTMQSMFQSSIFNQNINTWNVSNVTDMSLMFRNNKKYNQPMSLWNVTKVTDMNNMFRNTTLFNQDISDWMPTNVTDMTDFMSGTSFSVNNYNNLLVDWSSLSLKPNVVMTVSQKYNNSSSSAKSILTSPPYNWIIIDNGLI